MAGHWPHVQPALLPAQAMSVKSPSPADIIASAISPGPPSASMRHTIPARSCGPIPTCGAVASHSWSFRHAIVTKSAAMFPAMALPGSPSIPAVMTVLRSMTSNAARTQPEDSWLRGPGPGTNPARRILARVSSSRHLMNSAWSSRDAGLAPASDRASFSASSPIHASSVSDSSESIWVSCSPRGASIPGAGVAVGSRVGVLAGDAVGAALGLGVAVGVNRGAAVGSGVRPSGLGAANGVAAVGGAGAGVGSEQPASVARAIRMNMVARRGGLITGDFLSFSSRGSGFAFHSTCRLLFLSPCGCQEIWSSH